jgi:two-component system, NtrC family, sensor kinase
MNQSGHRTRIVMPVINLPEELFAAIFCLLITQATRQFLKTETHFPNFDKWLKASPVVFVVTIGLAQYLDNKWFIILYWTFVTLLFIRFSIRLNAYPPARTLFHGLIPFLIGGTLNVLVRALSPPLYEQYSHWFNMGVNALLIWVAATYFYANRQKKEWDRLETDRLAEAEKHRRVEAQNAELEQLVKVRTAEISRQKEELEQTLTNLKTTQEQLIQREKLASLGELTAGIAHEIQNPLNFVNNFAEVSTELLDELDAEHRKGTQLDAGLVAELVHDLKQNVEKISHHGGRASAIVKGMLQHSRSSTGQHEPTNLNALADEYLKLAYHGYRAKDKAGATGQFNARFELIADPNLGSVMLNPQDMGRVLLNLCHNAFYATQQRAANLMQHAPLESYDPTVTITTERIENMARIRVRDNGTGMPEAVRVKIFQPFFTTKPTGEGTGLGLSLSYDIITKGHSGTLFVSSTEGEGTELVIELPIGL